MSRFDAWTGDEDLTLTVPLGYRRGPAEIEVHPSLAAECITEELPRAHQDWAAPMPPPPAAPVVESFPNVSSSVPFTSAPLRPSEISLRFPRARFDSETSVSTWKKTIPALRRMVGLPIVPGWAPAPATHASAAAPPRRVWSPLVSITLAVGLVAMVVMTIVGFGSRAAEATRQAHTRIVSATGVNGAVVADGRVFVDGRAECESTPCELELASGVHWITVRAPGYQTPPSRSIHAGADEPTDVSFELVRAGEPVAVVERSVPANAEAPAARPATELAAASLVSPARAPKPAPVPSRPVSFGSRLNVNAIPAANVVLDGRPVGSTPLMGLKVSPGPHTVVLIGKGGRAVRSITVAPGKTAVVGVRF